MVGAAAAAVVTVLAVAMMAAVELVEAVMVAVETVVATMAGTMAVAAAKAVLENWEGSEGEKVVPVAKGGAREGETGVYSAHHQWLQQSQNL